MDTTITTSDGRQLTYTLQGAETGPVVLVQNGTPNSRLILPTHVREAKERGIRLLSYDRPGYGGSSRKEGRNVADAVDDIRTIAEYLGIDRMVTWGISGGGPHALACAALAPDLFAAVATLASVGPYGVEGFDFFEDMGTQNIESFQLTASDPAASAQKAAEEWPLLLAATPESLKEQWATILSPTDAAAVTGEVADYFMEMLRSGMAPGPEGYIDDGVAFTKPWGFELSEITVPVQLWQGRQDRFVPYGHGKWLSEQIPGVEAHLTEDDGHLTLLQHVDQIHEWLLKAL